MAIIRKQLPKRLVYESDKQIGLTIYEENDRIRLEIFLLISDIDESDFDKCIDAINELRVKFKELKHGQPN